MSWRTHLELRPCQREHPHSHAHSHALARTRRSIYLISSRMVCARLSAGGSINRALFSSSFLLRRFRCFVFSIEIKRMIFFLLKRLTYLHFSLELLNQPDKCSRLFCLISCLKYNFMLFSFFNERFSKILYSAVTIL